MQRIAHEKSRIFPPPIKLAPPVGGLTALRTQQDGVLDCSGGFRRAKGILSGILLVMLLMMPSVSGQSNDPYSLKFVSQLMEHYGRFSSGWDEKGLTRLGDKGAIALIKLSSLDSWNDPALVHMAMGIIRDSFSHPELIENPSDRHPRVTNLLLSWLRSLHKDHETRNDIDRTQQFVDERTTPK